MITQALKPDTRSQLARIRRKLEAERFTFGRHSFGGTASFGISGFQGGEPPSVRQLLGEADPALYPAKRSGRSASGSKPKPPEAANLSPRAEPASQRPKSVSPTASTGWQRAKG